MSGEIAAAAKTWLAEPRYAAAFKLTTDVFKDNLCNVSLAVGSLALAVNFLASMGSGPINCILKSVRSSANPSVDLGQYPSGVTMSLGRRIISKNSYETGM